MNTKEEGWENLKDGIQLKKFNKKNHVQLFYNLNKE